MNGPAKNRLHDYEAGWLSMLVETGLATRQEAEAAQRRVMQRELDRIRARKPRRGSQRRKRDRDGEE